MWGTTIWDVIFVISLITIWLLMLYNLILAVGGAVYVRIKERRKPVKKLKKFPFISIIVPAHDEELVIRRTLLSLLNFNYPKHRYEIFVVNDNSSDRTGEEIRKVQQMFPDRNIRVLTTDQTNGGKGKSNALNLALREIRGSLIAIYDADNTPEPDALRILATELMADDRLAAVTGKIRTRNKTATLLTRMINIETLTAQYSISAGRSLYFGMALLTGTNYLIRREIVEQLGGWNEAALTEDTELSYRIYRLGYKIRFSPIAVSWEQEPQRLGNWFHQRSRWVRGNFYVMVHNLPAMRHRGSAIIWLDMIHYLLMHVSMLVAVTCSDVIAVLGWLGYIGLTTPLAQFRFWIGASIVFYFTLLLSLSQEKKEFRPSSFLWCMVVYAYCKLWHLVVYYSMWISLSRRFTGKSLFWDKTRRYKEGDEHDLDADADRAAA